jgi:hypothetical protein
MILYIIATALVFLTSIIIFFVLNKKAALKNMKLILFSLLFFIIMAASGLLALVNGVTSSMLWFYVLQAIFFMLGYLLCYLLKKNFFGELENEKLSKVLFVLANAALGMIGFSLLFDHFSPTDLAPYYSVSLLTFAVPQFLAVSFEAYSEIPQEIYKIWYYPDEEKEIDFDKIDTSKVFMLEMEFSKSINDNHLVNSKAKAPMGMQFGDWFMSFIDNYNHKFDKEPIQYLNSDNTSHGWIFYVKPSFFGTPKYIDPDLTITENRISEKNVIIARRAGAV